MVRTQIQLTEDQAETLKAVASRRGISMAELIRQSIDQLVARSGERSQQEQRQRAAATAGAFRSGKDDISVHHDQYLADAVEK